MPTPKILVLMNPRSGNREGSTVKEALQGSRSDTALRVLEIDFHNLDHQLAEAAHVDRLVVAGGDGTVSAVMTHPALPSSTPVAIIPLGTANDVARELGLATLWRRFGPKEFFSRILELPDAPCDTWNLVTDSRLIPFAAYCSFGFEGVVVREFSEWRDAQPSTTKGRLVRIRNRLTYTTAALKNLRYRLPPLQITTNSGETREIPPVMSLLFTNIRAYMGLGSSTTISSAGDGLIECSATRSVLDYARIVGGAIGGTTTALTPYASSTSLYVAGLGGNTPLQVDGEAVASLTENECRIELRRTIRVVTAFDRGLSRPRPPTK